MFISRKDIRRARRLGGSALVATAVLFAVGACSNRHEDGFPRASDDPVVTGVEPPRATGLRANVGSRSVTLYWDDLGTSVSRYRVFRREGMEAEAVLATSVSDTTLADTGLSNGVTYRYRVAAIVESGLIGDPSDPVVAVPNAYGVLIEDGEPFANDETLRLTLTAPSGTSSMRFAESASAIENAGWRAFATSTFFSITGGDGVRTVYAQFLDATGNESQIVADDVTLDTRAEVLSVSHDAGTAPVAPGETIRFVVMTGEVGGDVTVDIEGSTNGIELFDDGAHGDGGADDGTYAVNWVVPTEAEVRDAIVFGSFIDAAGNFDEGTAAETLTLNGPPAAVALNSPSNVSVSALDLSWSQNQNSDFAIYRVVRARTSDVLGDPQRTVLASISDQAQTSFTDDALIEGTQLYYVVETVDEFGASAPSNTVSATIPNEPPSPVTLDEQAHTPVSVSMRWTASDALDFALYRIMRAVDSSPGAFVEVAQFDQQDRVAYTDFFAASGSTVYYFYKVVVEDLSGDSSESNVISVEVTP